MAENSNRVTRVYGGGVLATRVRNGRISYELRGVTSRVRLSNGNVVLAPWSNWMPVIAPILPNDQQQRWRVNLNQNQSFGFPLRPSGNIITTLLGGTRSPVEMEVSYFDAATRRRETFSLIATGNLGASAEFIVPGGASEIRVRVRSTQPGFTGDYVMDLQAVSTGGAQDFRNFPTWFRRNSFDGSLFGEGEATSEDSDAVFYQRFQDGETANEDGSQTGASEFYLVYHRQDGANRVTTYSSGTTNEQGQPVVSSKIVVVSSPDGSVVSASLQNDEGTVDLTRADLAALGMLSGIEEVDAGYRNATGSMPAAGPMEVDSKVFGLRFYRQDGIIKVEANGGNLRYDARSGNYLSPGINDTQGSVRRYELIPMMGPDGQPLMENGKQVFTRGATHITSDGLEVIVRDEGLPSQRTELRLANNPVVIDFGDAGQAIGSVLGNYLADGNELVGVLASGTLSAVLGDLGQALNGVVTGRSVGDSLTAAFDDFGPDLLDSLKSAGIGAVSSFLTAQLVNAIGLDGFVGELANTAAGSVLTTIANNLLTNVPNPFANIGAAASLGSAVGSFIGNKLATELVSFGSIGGQLGSAVGSALGSIAGFAIGKIAFQALGTALAGPLGAAIGAFVGTLLGGAIGSLFGGTPRSGADVDWDAAGGQFVVNNLYSKKGGSKDAAKAMATAVAETFNGILQAVGGTLLDPEAVQSGNYGMRKSDLVYRPTHTRDKDAITFRVKADSKDAMSKMIGYGVYKGLTDGDFRIAGGDTYVKRALYNSFATPGVTAANFDPSLVLGNIEAATRYETYLANSTSINALIAAEPDSVFAAEWALTLARAVELGLTKRHESDWYGGFEFLLKEAETNVAHVEFGFDYDPFTDRISRSVGLGEYVFGDSIDAAGQTLIEGTDAGETITLTHADTLVDGTRVIGGADRLANAAGLRVDGELRTGGAVSVAVAAIIEAGGGDDVVHAGDMGNNVFGGAGNDTLYGGKLDDWLLGGEGNDVIHAGSQSGGLGGSGNYLDGGAGDDTIYGREGSDWLEGGDGTDMLDGGGDDDVLAGGAGAADSLKGGHGDDQYLVRVGDGADTADETAAGTIVNTSGGVDRVRARFAGIAAGTIRRNWLGDLFDLDTAEAASAATGAPAVAAVGAGGDDAIVFGQGIEIGDLRIARTGATGSDLLIQVMTIDPVTQTEVPSGTELVVRDWFSDPFKRVEWLKFADGTEIRIGDVTSFVLGDAGNNTLIGTDGNDFVYGGAGNDRLHLLAGDDIGNGGTGDDMVAGDDGEDLVIGGLGVDELIGGRGNDALSGDAGNDDLYGGEGDDLLSGGRGDDQVAGGAGDDRFKYARGDGRDTVIDEFSDHWAAIWTSAGGWAGGYVHNPATGEVTGPYGEAVRANVGTAAEPDLQWVGRFNYDHESGTLYRFDDSAPDAGVVDSGIDTIEFAIGIDIDDIVLFQSGNDLVLAVSDGDAELGSAASARDSVALKNWYLGAGGIDKLAFYQTGELNIGGGGTLLKAGTDGNDGTATAAFAGTVAADWISSGAGDDVVAGGGSDDILAGNSGSDTLRGETGNDVLYGGTGNDILDGGAGADTLVGGSGIDTASYNSSTAVRAHLSAPNANSGNAIGDVYSGIENLLGGSGADTLGGDEGDNELTGGKGNDVLLGGAGDDTYVWTGADFLDTIREGAFEVQEAVTATGALAGGYSVSKWENTFVATGTGGTYWRLQVTGPGGEIVYDWAQFAPTGFAPAQPAPAAWDQRGWQGGFARTNGQQVTREHILTGEDGGVDTIEFAAGISIGDVTFERWGPSGRDDAAGPDLVIRYNYSQLDSITIKNHFSSHGGIEYLQFHDGLTVSLASILVSESGATLNGTSGDDLIQGQVAIADDHLAGGDGNDVIYGLRGNDLLEGGAGNDVLEGGVGADRIDGGSNSAASATSAWGDTVRYARSAAVTIDLRNTTTGQLGGDAAGDILTGIENVVGSTSHDVIHGDDGGNRIDGLDGNNTLYGWGGDDLFTGGTGTDRIYGGDGSDAASSGDGSDQMWGGAGDDTLDGSTGNDILYGEADRDTLVGGDGDDTLDGGAGDDRLIGGAGSDTLTGGDGTDMLAGGAGNDGMAGGLGGDTYVIEAGSGADTITDAAGANIVHIGSDIGHERIWLSQAGQDLRIGVIGTTDAVTVTGFFAAAGASQLRMIQTATHAIYLDHPDTRNLIAAMSAVTADTPSAMDETIAATLASYWHEDGKAAPSGPVVRELTTAEDTPLAIDASAGVVDHDRNIVSYAVREGSAPAHGTVTVANAATGAMTYTPGANFNGSDDFTIVAVDADGKSVDIAIQVSVSAQNDGPSGLRTQSGAPLSVAEAAPGSATGTGTIVGRIVADDAEGENIIFSLADTAGGRFAITSDGVLQVASASLLDREAAGSHVVRVRATDGSGMATEKEFTVAVSDVNEANSIAAAGPFSVQENAAVGTLVGTLSATDPDAAGTPAADQRYYFLNGATASATSADGRYAINALTGAVTVAKALDHETMAAPGSYVVIARDNAGQAGYKQAQTTVSIGVSDVNEANSLAPKSFGVDENVAAGTAVGTIAATDADLAANVTGQQRYFFLNGTAASTVSSDGRYAIDSLTGIISVNAALNYETMSAPVTYNVIARDNPGSASYFQAQSTVTLQVRDRNEANAIPASHPFTINENVAIGTVAGKVTATDADLTTLATGQQRYYFWDGTNALGTSSDGRFTIDAVTGNIKTAVAINYETMTAALNYTVVARDNAGAGAFNQVFTAVAITTADLNEAVTTAGTRNLSIAENSAVGSAVGTITATDPDLAGNLNGQLRFYFLNAGVASGTSSDGRYAIDSVTGVVSTATGVDYETMTAPGTYTVAVRDRQGQAGYTEATSAVTIAVANVNEAPNTPGVVALPGVASEGSTTWVAQFTLSDPDLTVPTLRLLSNPDGAYIVSGSEIRFAGGAAPNFETLYAQRAAQGIAPTDSDLDGLWEFALAATIDAVDSEDPALSSPDIAGSVILEDVNEAPISLNWTASAAAIAERDRLAPGTARPQLTLGTLSVTDPDIAGLPTNSYTFSTTDARFGIVGGNTLVLLADQSLDYEAGSSVSITVTARDAMTAGSLSISRTISFTVENRDDVLHGDALGNVLNGQQNRDLIYGLEGNDTIFGGAGNDLVEGGAGGDNIYGDAGADTLYGGDGGDILTGGADNDVVDGGLEADSVYGGDGADQLYGGDGDDALLGGAGADRLDGGAGSDFVLYNLLDRGSSATSGVTADLANAAVNTGTAAGDTYISIENLTGSGFDDILRGDGKRNLMRGLAGNDVIVARGNELVGGVRLEDEILGGDGNDILYGDYEDDTLNGATSAYTDHGRDILRGEGGNDTLYGGRGNDLLDGGEGDDILHAEHDDDTLIGGAGNDTLYGGTGSDTYIANRTSGADILHNFNPTGADSDELAFENLPGQEIIAQDIWFERVDAATGAASATGADLKISVIGTTSSVTVKNWFPQASGSLYRINLVSTVDKFTRDLNIDALVALMVTKPKPATAAALATLMADPVYEDKWATLWQVNEKPTIAAVADQVMNEDGTITVTINVSDDITNGAAIGLTSTITSGGSLVAGAVLATASSTGNTSTRTLTITPVAHASGVVTFSLQATDASNQPSAAELFTLTIKGVVDTPVVTGFAPTPGTAGQAGGIALNLSIDFKDIDGSEVQTVAIAGVPAGVTLSAGTYDAAAALWRLTPAQLVGLKLNAPAGWSQDLNLTATATSTESGASATATRTATVAINAPPTGATLSGSAAENAANGTAVGTVTGTDPDGDALTYTLVNNAGGRFALTTAGALSVANGTLLNFEAASSHGIVVRVTDPSGQYKDQALTVALTNVNEAATIPATYGFGVDENVAVGTAVGTVLATDPDGAAVAFGQQRYYFLNAGVAAATSADGRYTIDAVTGAIKTAAALSYETMSAAASYTVVARDNAGAAGYLQVQTSVSIGVRDLNEANAIPAGYAMNVSENVGVGTLVGTVVASDLDLASAATGQQRYYFWNGTTATSTSADGRYTIDAVSGAIKTALVPNYEALTGSNYTVVARDNQGAGAYNQVSTSVYVSVNNVNEANSLPASYAFSLDENIAVGTIVGSVAATDLDSAAVAFGQQRYYFLNGSTASATSADGRYTIDAVSGAIKTATGISYETMSAPVTYTVIARDNAGSGNQVSTAVTLSVRDLNEQNALPASYGFTVNENVPGGTVVGSVAASDPDLASVANGQQRYYFLNAGTPSSLSADGRYAIDAVSGVITSYVALNYETMSAAVAYTVVARDAVGGAGHTQAQTTVTIAVADLNEANAITSGYSFGVDENVGVGTHVGSVAASDTDFASLPTGQQRYYFWNGSAISSTSADGRYAIDAVSGAIRTASGLNYEAMSAAASYTVVARDNAGAGAYNQVSTNVTIGVRDLNEANAIGASYYFGIAENYAVGTAIGTIGASDADLGSNTTGQQRYYFWNGSAISSTSADGRYAIDALSGVVRTNAGLNYETMGSASSYTVVARDNAGNPGYNQVATTLTVGLGDVNEANAMPGSYGFAVSENVGIGTAVGTVAATDQDSASSAYGQQRYYFWNGAISSTSSDGLYAIDAVSGQITTAAGLNYEAGSPTRSYTVVARDNQGTGHQVATTVQIAMQDVNEMHSLGSHAITVNETTGAWGTSPYGPFTPVPTVSGQNDLRAAMLSDPENGAVTWRFANGTTSMGAWQIDANGKIWLSDQVDYETMTDRYDYVMTYYDPYTGEEYWDYQYVGSDPSLATFTLPVEAVDSLGRVASGNLTVTVANVNEAPTIGAYGTYRSGGGSVVANGYNDFWVTADRDNGQIIQITASDPERSYGFTYSISNLSYYDQNVVYGGNDEIDGSYPTLSINYSTGLISFNVIGDPDWEGGTKINSQRRTHSIVYNFTLNVTDSSGMTSSTPFKITFVRRGHTTPPILFDLDGDGLEMVAYNGSNILFDMDADGIRDRTGWAGADDGLLALDRNGDGTINDINEISFIDDAEGALSDLEGLRAFDSNANGFLDAGDERYGEFRIWRDADQDGVSQAGELLTLEEAGIVSVNLTLALTGEDPATGADNVLYGTSEYLAADGTTRAVGDVFFAYDPSNVDTIAAPVVLDYDGDGSGLVALSQSGASFDMDGDGDRERTGWIASGDALLALDRNGDGEMTDIREISFIGDKPGATTDLEGLAAFDTNSDGVLSALDARFAEFKLWFDNDGDGVSDAGELLSLAEAGIASIALDGDKLPESERGEAGGNLVYANAAFERTDGTTGLVTDAGFAYAGATNADGLGHSGWSGGPAEPAAPVVEAGAAAPQESAAPAPAAAPEAVNAADPAAEQAAADAPAAQAEGPAADTAAADAAAQAAADGTAAAKAADAAEARLARLTARLSDRPKDLIERLPALQGIFGRAEMRDLVNARANNGDAADTRLGLMVQEMAAFGARAGEGEWQERAQSANQRYDYFAG